MWNAFQNKEYTSLDVLICLYNTLFLSFLEYVLLHHMLIPYSSYRNRLSELSHFNLPCLTHFHSSMTLKLLTIFKIFELFLLTFFIDSVNKTSPSCFRNFFSFRSSIPQHDRREGGRGQITPRASRPHATKFFKVWWAS